MAWRRTGDKPLSEPMVAQDNDAYMRNSASICYMHMFALLTWRSKNHSLGVASIIWRRLTSIGIPITKIRRCHGSLNAGFVRSRVLISRSRLNNRATMGAAILTFTGILTPEAARVASCCRVIVIEIFWHLNTRANISFLPFVNCVFIHGTIISFCLEQYFMHWIRCLATLRYEVCNYLFVFRTKIHDAFYIFPECLELINDWPTGGSF